MLAKQLVLLVNMSFALLGDLANVNLIALLIVAFISLLLIAFLFSWAL